MKKAGVIILAILMTMGLGTAANAALTFDVDFWVESNPVNNYVQGGPGSGDLGGIFDLIPGEQINVDIYFSTDQSYTAGSWDLQYSPAALASVLGTTAAGSPWALPDFALTPGSVKYQDLVFPPGATITGEDNFFGSVLFECTGLGDVDLVLSNYLGFINATGAIDNFDDVNLGTLNQVPIPGAVWLLGSALVGLIGLRRRNRS
jgi:hypothetical protein